MSPCKHDKIFVLHELKKIAASNVKLFQNLAREQKSLATPDI